MAMGFEESQRRGSGPARLALLLITAAVFSLAPAAAQAAPDSFIVASNLDSADGDAGDGDCDPNDDGSEGDCTLRAAIQEANALDPEGEAHTIGFSGAMTIQPASPLPTVVKRAEINAGSDPECATTPANAIFIDGQGAVDIGLQINGQKSLVCGLTVGRFTEIGILVGGEQTLVKRSQIGTNTAGTGAMANEFGVQVSADDVGIEANLISGNTSAGVRIVSASSNTVLRGNRIGTAASGASALGNGVGIRVEDGYSTRIGGTSVAQRNVISGNSTGIWVFGSSSGAKIEGNFIGANASGSGAIPNTGNGVWLNSSGTQTVGGAVSASAQSTDGMRRRLQRDLGQRRQRGPDRGRHGDGLRQPRRDRPGGHRDAGAAGGDLAGGKSAGRDDRRNQRRQAQRDRRQLLDRRADLRRRTQRQQSRRQLHRHRAGRRPPGRGTACSGSPSGAAPPTTRSVATRPAPAT